LNLAVAHLEACIAHVARVGFFKLHAFAVALSGLLTQVLEIAKRNSVLPKATAVKDVSDDQMEQETAADSQSAVDTRVTICQAFVSENATKLTMHLRNLATAFVAHLQCVQTHHLAKITSAQVARLVDALFQIGTPVSSIATIVKV
jgi:hypothetical protein